MRNGGRASKVRAASPAREYLVKIRMPEGEASLMYCGDDGLTWMGMDVLAVEEITPGGWWRSLWNRLDPRRDPRPSFPPTEAAR